MPLTSSYRLPESERSGPDQITQKDYKPRETVSQMKPLEVETNLNVGRLLA